MLRKSRCWICLLVFWGIMMMGIIAAPGSAAADGAWAGDWITIGSGTPTVSGDMYIGDPSGIAVDSSGNVYVADKLNCAILKKGYGSEVWTAIPNSPFQIGQHCPWAVAVDPSGNIYVVNSDKWNSGIIWKYDGAAWTDITKGVVFNKPSGIAVDSSYNVYVTDTYNGRVMKLPNGNSTWQTIGDNTPQNGNFGFPVGITVDNSSNLYVTDYRDETGSTYGYLRFLEKGNTTWGSKYFTGQSLLQPSSVAVDKFNNIYVANTKAKQIYVNLSGRDYWAYIDNAFNSPYGVAVDSYGNVYVTDQKGYWDNKIYKHQAWATQLGWTTQPGGAPSGNNLYPQPIVELKDGNGITVSADNSDFITAALTNPQGSTLSGTSTMQLSNGVAAYHDLNVNNAGTYTLTAAGSIASKNVTYFGANESGVTNFYDLPPAQMTCQSSSFTIAAPPKAATPTASPVSGTTVANNTTVTLSTATAGATIYYTTNGSNPDTSSPSGTSVVITGAPGTTVTVKAMAAGPGLSNSDIATFIYTIKHPGVAAPTANPPAGIYGGAQNVELKTDTEGASIYYTTDGTDPTTSSSTIQYTSAIEVTTDIIIKAVAVKEGMENSPVVTFEYIIVVFAGGNGSLDTPYQVATPEHLDNVRKCLDKHFIQTADIDLGVAPYNADEGWVPIGNNSSSFRGTFDGNGMTISNLTINRSTIDYVGLFGVTGGTAKIQNVGLENNNVNGHQCTGALVGKNLGKISDSYATGAVTGTDTYAGGLVGYNRSAISGSYTTGIVNGQQCTGGLVGDNYYGTITLAYSTSTVKGKGGVAGLAGSNSHGTINNSYAKGTASGTEDYIGGLVGWNFDGKVSCAYATGAVTGIDGVGGLVGREGTVSNSYWDTTTSGIDSSDGGTGKTTAEMKEQATYVDWDFTSIWQIEGSRNDSYPFLKNNPPDPYTANNATINPTSVIFDKNPANQVDITTTITWNSATSVTVVKQGDATLTANTDYTIEGNTMTIKKEYLAPQETGELALTMEFDKGKAATLTITISDTLSTDKTLISINAPSAITGVANGTAKTAAELGLPAKVTLVTNDGDVQADVSWDAAACSYDPDETTEQTFTVDGTITLPAGIVNTNNVDLTTSISVTVNAEVSTDKTLVSINTPSAITGVANGTAKTAAELGLPARVTLITNDGDVQADVSWDVAACSYDPDETTEQTFTVDGTVTLPMGVVNPNNVDLTTSISVTVNAEVSTDKTLISINAPSAITGVANGTAKTAAELGLPARVTLITNDGDVQADVSWDVAACSYDPDETTEQTFTVDGTVTLPMGVVNPDSIPLTTSINATVNAAVPAATYTLTIRALTGGSITTGSSGNYAAGTVIAITAKPASRYSFNKWSSTGGGTFANANKATTTYTMPANPATITASFAYQGSSGGGGGSSGTPAGTLVTYTGKTFTQNGVTLTFPTGAVENDIRVQVKEANLSAGMTLPDGSKLLSRIMDIIKDKSGDFLKPVTITLSFNKDGFNPDEYDIAIYYYEDAGKWIALENIKLNLEAGTISGDTTHFTKFTVIATPKAKVEKPLVPEPVVNVPGDISGHWAKDSIMKLMEAGIVSGYPDGTFQPNIAVTRAEFIVMLVKALNLETRVGKTFADTASHWAKDSISMAVAHGLVSGYDAEHFGSDNLITREQAAVIISRAAQLEAAINELNFTDRQAVSTWATPGVAAAFKSGFISGHPDGSFRPQGNTTRAEAAVMIGKLL